MIKVVETWVNITVYDCMVRDPPHDKDLFDQALQLCPKNS